MNRLIEIFSFSEAFPLIFTQAQFWIFFALVYVVFTMVYHRIRLRNTYLLFVSLFFYYKTSGLYLGLLVFTILTNFLFGRYIYKSSRKSVRFTLITLSVVLNLFVLSYYKYAYFFIDTLNYLIGTSFEVTNTIAVAGNTLTGSNYFTIDKIILPVGISFFTFQAMTYVLDIYRGKMEPVKSVGDFSFFVSFFPQLVAGPIVRASEFIPQINRETQVTREDFSSGVFLIIKGLIKKMIFADYIAMHFLDRVFDAPQMFSGFTNIMAMIGYSLQIYGDFSGYTDIAIGLALLMGFKLPKNFNSPYKALNVADFWRRWHMTLSSFLRDYLYIPLGGNRKGKLLTNVNLMLTMLIGGLWHGASWKFVIWGGLNGVGLVTYKFWKRVSPWEKAPGRLAVVWKIALTFTFITFTRIYFRGEDMAHISAWYHQVWTNMDWAGAMDVLINYRNVFIVMLIGFITHWLPYRTKELMYNTFAESHYAVKLATVVATGILCYQAYSASFQPFIYFQF